MTLFSPINFKNLVLPNRLVMSPMCMYSADNGEVNDFHLVHYGSRAQGGIGLIITEATGVVPEGRISNKCAGIWSDIQAEKWRKVVHFVHQNSDTKMGIQLAHAGRKASTWMGAQISIENGGWETVAPSKIPYKEGERIPHELSISEIKNLVEDFKKAAKRAINSGFDVIEIHAAHGYLLHQFLSPLSNVRTDEYGGNLKNRARFLVEIVDAIQEVLNENVALFVRISASDYAEKGWDIEECVELSKILKEKNVDVIDVSSGGNIHYQKIEVKPLYQVPFSKKIRKEAQIKTGTVGLITTSSQAENILKNEEADLIFLARELLRNPYFPVKTAFENNENCFFPKEYERGKP